MKGIILTLSLLCFSLTYGYSRFKREIPNGYGVNHPCPGKGHWDAVGHMNGGYTPQKNVFGVDFRDGGKSWTYELCMKDSDGDGLTNGEELGDPQCKWRRGDRAPEPPKGHPGFCERDRRKCDSGMTHSECPNPRARGRGRGQGRGQGRTPPRRILEGANDHPQTTLSKNLDRIGGMGQSIPGFGRDRGMSLDRPSGFPSSAGRFSIGSGGFDSSSGGRSSRPSVLDTSGSLSLGPTARPGFTSAGSFGAPSMSQDFGVSDERYLGRQPPGMTGTSLMTGGRGDFTMMQSPGMDRFRSSLDQRSIQGMGSSVSGPSFQSSMSQRDIERSVQARMDRERSLIAGGRRMPSSMGSDSMGFSSMGFSGGSSGSMGTMGGGSMSPMGGGSMDSMGGGGMGSVGGGGLDSMGGDSMGSMGGGSLDSMGGGSMGSTGGGSMGSMRAGGMSLIGPGGMGPRGMGPIGPGGMSPMGPGGMVSGFSGGMERYPPFMTRGSPGFGGPPFSGGVGGAFSGRMSMPGIPAPRFSRF